jgi:hypothetical protein
MPTRKETLSSCRHPKYKKAELPLSIDLIGCKFYFVPTNASSNALHITGGPGRDMEGRTIRLDKIFNKPHSCSDISAST